MNINDNLRSRSLELIKYYQSHACDSSNISTFINKMSELMIDEESFKECRLSFIAEDFQQFIIKMCLLSPITDIGKLRAMGFSTVLDYLSTTKDEYIKLNCKEYSFHQIFSNEDINSVRRSLLYYLSMIISEYMPISDRFEDIKIKIYNDLLTVAIYIQEQLFSNRYISLEYLTYVLRDSCFCDKLGYDDDGFETFFHKLGIDPTLSSSDLYEGIYAEVLSRVTKVGERVVNELESFWLPYPERLIIYMNLKQMIYANNPAIRE